MPAVNGHSDKDTEPSGERPYQGLDPETVLHAVESAGLRCDGRVLALNSYENRVYQVGLEDTPAVIVKFYRPGRWSDEAILEEHGFAFELAAEELPVIAPIAREGVSLFRHAGFRFALFPRQGGRAPELEHRDVRLQLGRLLGRIHALGGRRPFSHRPVLGVGDMGLASSCFLLEGGFIPPHLQAAYRSLAEDLITVCEQRFQAAEPWRRLRLHGDCHLGNILWTDRGPHFVDLDDCRTGPAVQDLWMLVSGERHERAGQWADLLEGYTTFFDFDWRQMNLVEPLRTLRIMHYAAWIGRRWEDPAFPLAFPWFDSPRYWEEHVLSLREQAAALEEPPLAFDL